MEKTEYSRKQLNIRRMFKPDPGHVVVDADLAGADAWVFAWQCGDGKFKSYMKTGVKMHVESNKYIFPDKCGADGKREPFYSEVKSAAHGTDYGAGYRTLAENLGWPEWRSKRFQDWWFTRFPEIRAHHRRTESIIQIKRQVSNPWGYRIYFFGDVERSLPEALAWTPQSTIGILCSRGALRLRGIYDPKVLRILLQVHDSLVLQIPHSMVTRILPEVREHLNSIVVPFPEPLQVPWSFKWSVRSWGHCVPVNWDSMEIAA